MSDLHDYFGQTPLHVATRTCADLAVLSELVNCGVDLDARTRVATNETCNNIAIVSDNADALRLFLLAGANVGVNGTQGTDHEPLLHTAVVQKNFTCAMLLLAAGADVATCDRKGRTACLLAALESSGPMMSFVHAMLAVGADLDALDGDGNTPRLCLAARQVNVEPVQVAAMRREIAAPGNPSAAQSRRRVESIV